MPSYPPWPSNAGSPSSHPPAYPPPPPIPPQTAQNMVMPPELQALNITPQQMAALFSHLQAGTIPFPPPPPPPPPQSYTPAAPYPNVPIPPHFSVHSGTVPTITGHVTNGANSRTDIDREEGEVSDVSQRQHDSPPALSASKKRKLRASAKKSPLAQSTQVQNDNQAADVSVPSLVQKKEAVLPFIAALHKEGFTFPEFVREGFDETLLRQVYEELRIPILTAQPEKQATDSGQAAASSTVSAQTLAPANTSAPKSSEAVKMAIPAKPAAPMSRQDYLARLQAAKTKKSDAAAAAAAATAASSKQPVQPASSAAPSPSAPLTAPVKVPNDKDASMSAAPKVAPLPTPASVPKKQSQTTELVRKKMEALKALKATQLRLASNGASTPPTPSVPVPLQTRDETIKPASAQPTPTALQAGSIPGLYMSVPAKSPQSESHPQSSISESASVSATSVAPTVASKSVTPQPANVVSFSSNLTSRKRPVASDLNEAYPAVDQRPFKRPFGQSRQNSSDDVMIIVSEDEDSSDDDEVTSKPTSREKNIRDLPPLRDFRQRPGLNRQHSAFTPPQGTPGISTETEELKRKEQEITTLNLRIREAEMRKAALKARAHLPPSQPHTPSEGKPATQPTAVAAKAGAVPVSSSAAQNPDARPSPARRAEIQASLSACELKKSTSEARIQELQNEIARIQREAQESEEKQQKLREELESLDVNTDGMTQSQMEAKKQEINDLRNDERIASTSTLDSNSSKDTTTLPVSHVQDTQSPQSPQAQESLINHPLQGPVADPTSNSDEVMSEGESDTSTSAAEREDQFKQPETEQPQTSSFQPDTDSSMSESIESEDEIHLSTSNEFPNKLQLNQEQIPDVAVDPESDSAMDEGSSTSESSNSEENVAPEELVWLYCNNIPYNSTKDDIRLIFEGFDVRNIHAPRKDNRSIGNCFVRLPRSEAERAKTRLHGTLFSGRKLKLQVARRPPPQELLSPEPLQNDEQESASKDSSDDDEMDISESSSSDEDEEIEVGQNNLDIPTSNIPSNDEAGAVSSPSESSAESSDEEEDDDDEEEDEEEEDEDRMDLESETSSTSSPDAAAISDSTTSQSKITGTNEQNVADDLATELQPDTEQQTEVSEAVNRDAPEANDTSFVPYQSVLRKFKGYRFHPEFSKEVQGGYHSLTYSHQIDPHKELCRYEVASGVCNDHSCNFQHFRDMAVTDNDVIMQMATDFAKHGRDAEEVERFKAGLATVLQQLQDEGNTDTDTMAARVAQYRRDFNQDPTDILGL